MHKLVFKSVFPNSNYRKSKKGPQMLCSMGYSLWYIKIDQSEDCEHNIIATYFFDDPVFNLSSICDYSFKLCVCVRVSTCVCVGGGRGEGEGEEVKYVSI